MEDNKVVHQDLCKAQMTNLENKLDQIRLSADLKFNAADKALTLALAAQDRRL
jgi:hypothetical protein